MNHKSSVHQISKGEQLVQGPTKVMHHVQVITEAHMGGHVGRVCHKSIPNKR